MKKILFFLLAIIFAIQGYSQTVQTSFGTTTQYYLPIYTNYGYNYTQQIVTNADLVSGGLGTTFGQITKIRWHWNGSGSFANCYNWKIFIGHTTKTAFSSSSDWEPVTNLTVVFDSLITIPTTAGWMEVNLQTPFTYNGTDNLIIAVDENTTNFSSTAYFTSTSGYTNRGIYYFSDSSNPDPLSPPSGTRVSTVPNIQLYFYETCPSPGNLTASNISHENATISWTPTGTEIMWNLEYKMSSDATWTLVSGLTSPSYTLTSLTPNTTYNVRVQADCGTDQSAFIIPINFTTLFTAPATLPYNCDFENSSENQSWGMINGTQVNKWYIGDATQNPAINNTIGGSNALYVSNNNGADWAYSASNSWVYAYRDFEVPAGVTELKLDFDWIANGGAPTSEFLRVYWMPTNIPVTAGNLPPTINTVNYDLAAMIGNYNNGYGQHWLSTQTTWQHSTFTINTAQYPNLAGNIWRLYVHWRNNQSTAVQPPATFDNMSLVVSSCLTPLMDSIVNITQTSANIHFTENGSAATWNVQYRILGTTQWSIASGSTNPFIINGLQSSTSYEVRMQSDCSSEQSFWTPIKKFNTACGPITQIPWVDYFDNYGTGTTVFPPCWTRKTTQTDRPYITSTNFSSPGSMYMFADIGAYNIASTPMFDISIPINTLQLNFKYRTYNATDTLLIGVMTDPQDSSTFVPVSFVTASSTGTWFDKEVPLNSYIGTGQYIAFKIATLTTNRYSYIDNLVVSAIPTCPRPYQLTASNPTVNSIDLNWIEVGTATQWEVEYGAPGFVQGTGTTVLVSAISPYTLTGLNSATTYDFYIRSICGTDYSPWSLKVSATTACGVFALPFTQNFDSASFPVCWSQTYSGALSSNRWSVNDGSEAGGTPNEMECDWQNATGISRLISPAIDFTNIVNPILTFKHFYSDYDLGVTLKIQTSTDMITWVDQPFSIISGSGDVGPATVEIVLANLTGVNYIAWVVDGDHFQFNQWYIDNVFIQEAPSCPNISLLSVVSSTSTDITLNWTFSTNANQGFELAYSNVSTGFDPNTPENTITIPDGTPLPYTIPSLTAAQFYSFAVRQACNGAWSNIVVTNTDGLPAQVPYTCDFSDIIEKASWKISNGNATNKFFIGTPSNNVPPVVGDNLFISDTEGATNSYNTSSTSTAIASRLIEFSGDGGYVLNFDLIIGGETSYDYIKVFLTDPDTVFTGSNTKPYYAINSYNGNNQLLTNYNSSPYFNAYDGNSTTAGSYPRQIILPYQGPAGTVKKLIILWANDGGGGIQPPAAIDNISIQPLTCPVPTNIEAQNLTSTSANIVWQDPSATATEWIFKWRTSGATTWITDAASSSTYPLTTLTPTTEYEVSIATVCGSDTGVYANFTFITPCIDILIPYTNNFDNESDFPTCWTRRQNQSYPYIYEYNSYSSPNSLYFYAYNNVQYAATPPIDVTVPINTLQVSFKLYAYNLNTPVKFGVMTDPNNFSTFVQVGPTLYPSSSSTWEEKLVLLNNYAGTGRFFAIVAESSSSISFSFMIDDFKIEVIPSCPKPQFLNANTTDVTATMFWTETGTAQEWEVEWGLLNFVQGQGTIASLTDTFLLINNLTALTDYQFYVRSICGIGDTSLWAGPYSFNTQELAPVPYLEPFNSINDIGGYSQSGDWYFGHPTAVPGNPADNLYVNLDGYPTTASLYTTNIGPLQSNNILQFEYKLANYGSPYAPPAANSGNFVLAISTDWGITYTDIDTVYNNAIAGYQTYNIDLSAYASEIIKLKITGNWNSGDYYLAVDNIYVGPAITCPYPSALLTSNPTTTSIDLAWTEQGSATSWNIEYGPVGFTPGSGTTIPASSNPFTLNGLTHSMCYDFYVQAVCSPTDLSMWSNKGSFCTAQIPVNVPFTIDFETPSGFQVANNTTGNNWYIGTDTANTVNNTTGGQNALYVSNDNGQTNAFTITSAAVVWAYRDVYFTPSTADYTFSFNWKGNGEGTTTAYDYLSVYIGTPTMPVVSTTSTITVPTGSDTIVTKLRLQPTWQTATFTMPTASYSGQIKRIYFMWRNDGSGGTQPPASVDNISITSAGISTCTEPTNLAVNNILAATATATWTEAGSATQWQIAYKPTASSTWITAFVSPVATYNLPSLLAATAYDVKVRAICGAGDTSAYSAIVNFTTATSPCDIPTNVLVPTATITDQSAVVTWTAAAGQTQWQVEYKLVSSANWTTMPISTATTQPIVALQSNSTYEVRVKAICSATNESPFTTPVQFTTTGAVTYIITATASGPGTINPTGSVVVNAGANQTFTFTPTGNAHVVSLLVDNLSATYSNNEYTFSNVLANHTISVNFAEAIDENGLAKLVELYPNPTNATIEIRLNETQLQVKECRVYDIYGKLMSIVPVNADNTQIDATDFAAGVYFIRMNSEMGVITKKFVKK